LTSTRATDVFLTSAVAITLGLIVIHILSNIGVLKYYVTEGRPKFNCPHIPCGERERGVAQEGTDSHGRGRLGRVGAGFIANPGL
jgi:hypothetical protein